MTNYLLTNEVLINILCNIFTALGTVGAVIYSLYLTYKGNNPKPKVKINAKVFLKYDFNQKTNEYKADGKFVVIEVFNPSIVPVEINCFFWKFGLLKNKIHQIPHIFDHPLSSHPQSKVNYSQVASYYLDLSVFLKFVKKNMVKSNYWMVNYLRVKFFFIIVKSNLGDVYKSKLDKSLQEEILKLVYAE